ncbi:MAG: hypothetical protein ACYTGC_05850 [Planctomycetota bacterium]|jgi:hypothetical protein
MGKATEQAIERSIVRIAEAMPDDPEAFRVVEQISEREVRVVCLAGGIAKEGQELFLCLYDPSRSRLEAVLDSHTGKPIKARIISASRQSATAWLQGAPPSGTSLLDAQLHWQLPSRPGGPVAAAEQG